MAFFPTSAALVLLVLVCQAQDTEAQEILSLLRTHIDGELPEVPVEDENTAFLQSAVQMQINKGVANGVAEDSVQMPTCKAPMGPGNMPEEGACMQEQKPAAAAQKKVVAAPKPPLVSTDDLGRFAYYFLIAASGVLVSMALQRASRVEEAPARARGDLLTAVLAGDAKACSALLETGAKAGEMDSWGRTPLHVAAAQGLATLMTQLLDSGASVDSQDGFEETTLHAAARAGQAAMCELLLKRGATVNPANEENETPLLLAARSGQRDACKVLLDHGGSTPGVADEELPPLLSSLLVQRIFAELGKRPERPEVASDASSDDEQ